MVVHIQTMDDRPPNTIFVGVSLTSLLKECKTQNWLPETRPLKCRPSSVYPRVWTPVIVWDQNQNRLPETLDPDSGDP